MSFLLELGMGCVIEQAFFIIILLGVSAGYVLFGYYIVI